MDGWRIDALKDWKMENEGQALRCVYRNDTSFSSA